MIEGWDMRDDGGLEGQIRALLLRANRPEALGITQDTLEEVPDWVEARMAPILADPFGYAKRKARPLWRKVAGYAAGVALAVSLSLFSLYHVSPTARAWMDQAIQVVATWMDVHTTFHFAGAQTEGGVEDTWRPEWLPEGYVETRAVDLSGAQKVEFENQQEDRIRFVYMPVQEGYMVDVDNEHSDYSEVVINGQTASLFDSNTEGRPSYLIWYNETGTVAFELMAELPGSDLIQIAESIVVQND